MEYASKIKELIPVKAVCVEEKEIGEALQRVKKQLLNFPRIPNVIYVKRRYAAFTITDDGTWSDAYILIDESALAVAEGLHIADIALELNINYFSHTEILNKLIPHEHALGSFETIGDIIHLNLNESQLQYKYLIAGVLCYKTGCTIINKTGRIDNIFRFYESEILAGKDTLKTVHAENGVKIWLDLGKVYWCSRLQTERGRIAKMLKRSDVLCDPFCGAGALALQALKQGVTVYANDLNPDAIYCFKKSLALNRLSCDYIECMDAGEYIQSLAGTQIDHFVLNLPEHSVEYIKFLGGFSNFRLHCFFFCKSTEDPVAMIQARTGYRISPEWLRHVRMVSPSKAMIKLEVCSDMFYDFQKNSK